MAFTACWSAATPRDETRPIVVRTATPAINRGKWLPSVALSEFELRFLNGVQRSVNRKVQGSNPWSGANCKFETEPVAHKGLSPYNLCTSFVHPFPLRLACLHFWASLLPPGG